MKKPGISLIIPVYNAAGYLPEIIQSIQQQSFPDYEVIFVDDASSDDSVSIMQKAEAADSRFSIVGQTHSGAGAARNYGAGLAKGDYLLFLDCYLLLTPDCLSKLNAAALATGADVITCPYLKIQRNDSETLQQGIYKNWLNADCSVFHYTDCPDYIMQISGTTIWNKLYKADFLKSHGLKCDEILTCNDISFTAISLALASKISYIEEPVLKYRDHGITNPKKLEDAHTAILRTVTQAQALPYKSAIQNSIYKFVVGSYISALKNYVDDFLSPDAKRFYTLAHTAFNSEGYSEITPKNIYNSELYRDFCIVKKHDYETMKHLVSRRLIVSLTSYPHRIGIVAQCLETIYAQTHKADQIILWLAEEQFPGKEADLPQNLLVLIQQQRLCVRWCDDLKPHKKYFYAMQEYVDDVIVTIDDDLIYPKDMLAALYKSYLQYPEAVSALRTHLIVVSESDRILPYNAWPQETDACIYEPCMQLMATGGAGTLYPPNLLHHAFFDKAAIMENSPMADDLWLKAAQAISNVPVVLARPYEPLQFLPNSQEEALYHTNVNDNQNDVQLMKIIALTDKQFGSGALVEKLKAPYAGNSLCGIEAVSRHLDKERKSNRWRKLTAESKLQEIQERLKDYQSQLQLSEQKNHHMEAEWKKTHDALQELQEKQIALEKDLAQTQIKLQRAEESKPVKRQLSEYGQTLRNQRSKGHASLSWWIKYLVYLLAWIPETILVGTMFYLKNGFFQTVKYAFKRLFRPRE